MKKQEWPDGSKKLHGFRTFPHSNSKREIEERSKQDEQEAREYTTDFVANHFSRDEYPDVYEDRFVNWIMRKHITKPKWNDHKGKKSIRKDEDCENN